MRPGNASRIYRVRADATLEAVERRLSRALAPPARAYRPLRVDGVVAGWLTAERTERIAAFADVFRVNSDGIAFLPALADRTTRSHAIARVAVVLAAEGALTAWRNERYAVAPAFAAPPWFDVERAAARYFGIHTWAAHVNGLVRHGDQTLMWLARRSPHKAIDPGKWDNLVGGGIAAGTSVADTVVKEAWEEAGISPSIALSAVAADPVRIRRDQPDGLHWETIFVQDLWLPADFAPANQDGEAVGHTLVTLDDAACLIAIQDGPDEVTADASLVILNCLWRHGAIASDAASYRALEGLRSRAVHSLRAEPPS